MGCVAVTSTRAAHSRDPAVAEAIVDGVLAIAGLCTSLLGVGAGSWKEWVGNSDSRSHGEDCAQGADDVDELHDE